MKRFVITPSLEVSLSGYDLAQGIVNGVYHLPSGDKKFCYNLPRLRDEAEPSMAQLLARFERALAGAVHYALLDYNDKKCDAHAKRGQSLGVKPEPFWFRPNADERVTIRQELLDLGLDVSDYCVPDERPAAPTAALKTLAYAKMTALLPSTPTAETTEKAIEKAADAEATTVEVTTVEVAPADVKPKKAKGKKGAAIVAAQ